MSPQNIYYTSKVDIPEKDARQIAIRTAQLIRQTAPRGKNDSRRLVRATWQQGMVGIVFPSKASHLLFVDRGVRPFVMYALEGKTIPIRGKDGKLYFRTAKNVGQTMITNRDERGQIRASKRRWRHPGIEPQNFVEKAFQRSMKEYIARLKGKDILDIMKQAEGPAGEVMNRLLSTDSAEYKKLKTLNFNMKVGSKYVPSTGQDSDS